MNPETPTAWLEPSNWQSMMEGLGPKALELITHYGLATLGAFAVLAAAWVLGGWARKGIARLLQRTHVDTTTASFIGTIVRWAVLLGGVLVCFGVFGVETTSIAAVLGGAGVGIGVALQGNLSNLASGMLLIAFRPFTDNDWVELVDHDVDGRVRKVGLIFTEVDTFTNQRVVIPNQLLFDQPIINHEKHSLRRMDVPIGVAYDTNLEQAHEVLMNAACAVQEEMAPDVRREPVVWWQEFGASSIDAKVGAWCHKADLFKARNRLIHRIHKDLAEAGIEIPFPQRDLHLRQPSVEKLEKLAAK